MDFVNDTFDLKKLNNNRRHNMENITPHKIAVVAFIREFGSLKSEDKDLNECNMAPNYRKDFCILSLKLIQCPDMEFKDLETLLTNGRYNLMSVHLQNFCVRLQNIYVNGISALTDCVTSTEKLMIDQNETCPCVIARSSVLGLYLRRIMVYLDKLTFVQLSSLYKSFCLYYQKGRPGLMIRSLSKEKLNSVDQHPLATSSSPILPDESKPLEHSMKLAIIDRENNFEEHQWSLKQAELFTAQQANLLQVNEQKALPPQQLQKIIMQIINDIPEYPDIHFLSFLNCLRVKEFCGAQDSLYNCFDRSIFTSLNNTQTCTDRNKNFRYAALNRAAMHAQFEHNEVAMEGVREALVMAQEAGDGACLAHVACWAGRAGGRGRRAPLLARSPRAAPPAPAAAAAAAPVAAAAQLLAQHIAVNGTEPAKVFALITKGEAVNYLHSMTDLTMASLMNTAALWSLYGKTEMASVNCQLLLNFNTKGSGGGGAAAGAGGALAAAAWRGETAAAALLAAHYRAPAIAHSARATLSLHAGKWEDADQSIKQLASFDRWESQLLKAEMFYLKREPSESLNTLRDILEYCKTEDDSLHYISLKIRGMILMSQVKHTFCGIHSTNSSNIMLLNEVLSLAKKYHLHYLSATAEMHIANIQLHMGCVRNALNIVKRVLPCIMAHGGAYDMARAILLYSKCRVANAPTSGELRIQVLQSCCEALESVKKNFAKIDSQSRLLEIWYLQAQLYNEIGNHVARNQCAWMYRQLEAQNNIEPTNMFLISY